MPMPRSVTETRASPPLWSMRTCTWPPCGLYLMAFASRLTITCSRRGHGEEVGPLPVQLALLGDVVVDHQPPQVLVQRTSHRNGGARQPAVPRAFQLQLVPRTRLLVVEDGDYAREHRLPIARHHLLE